MLPRRSLLALLLLGSSLAVAPSAAAKEKPKPPPAKTGLYSLEPILSNVEMSASAYCTAGLFR